MIEIKMLELEVHAMISIDKFYKNLERALFESINQSQIPNIYGSYCFGCQQFLKPGTIHTDDDCCVYGIMES